jgi:hypothetical protein
MTARVIALCLWAAAFGITLAADHIYRLGWPYVYLIALGFSIIPMYLVQRFLEKRRPNYNPRTQSWAFLFGDSLCLPTAMAALAVMRSRIDGDGWFNSIGWSLAAALFGFAATMIAILVDRGLWDYSPGRLVSPSKLLHDYFTFPIFLGVLFYGLAYLIEAPWSPHAYAPILILISIAGWAAMLGRDVAVGLDPTKFHPEWDWSLMRIVENEKTGGS